jgi:8-oxo-dGTP pyrophosphatase MutT (NUDIX family)
MAASTVQTKALGSEKFVESCGALLFDLSDFDDIKVCLVQQRECGEWHFAKGRRNQGETRKDAAIREVMEETGFRCRLLPVTMQTRATPVDAHVDVLDKATVCEKLMEPFMCHIRTLKHGKGTKIIWWYIAVLEEDAGKPKLPGEDKWLPKFLPWHDAVNTLTFQNDRELLQRALEILRMTFPTLKPFPGNSQSVPFAILPTDASAGEQSTPKGFPSKTAAKKAVKAAKALKRLRDQEAQNNATPVKAEQMVKPIVDEAAGQRSTRQQEARKLKKATQRRRRAE